MKTDDEDEALLESLRLPGTPIRPAIAARAKPASGKRSVLVMMPAEWLPLLDAIPGEHAHRIVLRLLLRSWERKSVTVKASNEMLAGPGLSRNTKLAVLRRIAETGILSLDLSNGQAPEVTIHYPADHPALPYLHC